MYPIAFYLFGFPVSSFALLMAAGFVAACWITDLRMREEQFAPELTYTICVYAMLAGFAGSKLYFAVDTWLREGTPFMSLLFAREGITWYGGLIAGTLASAVGCHLHGISPLRFANCGVIGVAVGQALGRMGCYLVGDDYGRPSNVPWAVAFPQGSPPTLTPVHPTQLYEMAWLVLVSAGLWWRRKRSPFLFGEYLVATGIGRFVIELWRTNPPVALGFTEPQWIGGALVLLGAAGWVYRSQRLNSPEEAGR